MIAIAGSGRTADLLAAGLRGDQRMIVRKIDCVWAGASGGFERRRDRINRDYRDNFYDEAPDLTGVRVKSLEGRC